MIKDNPQKKDLIALRNNKNEILLTKMKLQFQYLKKLRLKKL